MTLDEALVEAIRKDYKTAPIDEADRAMLDYVAQLTRDATKVTAPTTTACAPPASTTAASSRSP